jgi:c-di-GMP-binding flagellar brake protein YcgR
MRLRAELRERVADDRVMVEPIGEAKEGDRRDFRRADVDARIRVRKCASRDTALAREEQLSTVVPDDSPEFESQLINLSGSGVGFESRESFTTEDLLDIRIGLELRPRRVVSMIGRIVRIIDRGEKGPPIVAVRFAELSESDQDTIIYSVFAAHFATVGLGDDEDFDQP